MKFIPSRFRLLAVVVCLTLLSGVALAGPVAVNVFASISPDPFGSNPTFLGWSANALNALQAGTSTSGAAGFPQYYSQVNNFAATDVIGTNFPYWRGTVNPVGNYAGQTGNMLTFSLAAYGNGTQFTMGAVSYADTFFGTSSTNAPSTVGYGARMVGINYGPDGVLGGGDDTIYNGTGPTPGTSSDLVDALFFSGFGAQFYVPTLADLPSSIAAIEECCTPTASGTYTVRVGDFTYQGSANIEMVPEPATLSFAGIGVLLLGLAARRRGRV